MPTLSIFHAHEDHEIATHTMADVMHCIARVNSTPTLAVVALSHARLQYGYGIPEKQQVTVKVFTSNSTLAKTFDDTAEAQAFFKLWLERLWN